jgi:geranylgeranyl diphosphate synthase type II
VKRSGRDRALIDRALKKYLNGLKGPGILCKAIKYVVFSGGKRLRPLLAIESSRALDGHPEKALPFACAIELIHNFSLVHDDLPSMDNDDLRRGKPTCHRKFGEAIAVLTGDALLNLAFGILSKTKHKRAMEIISLVSDAVGVENMIGGQVLDLNQGNRLPNLGGSEGGSEPPRFGRRLRQRKIDAMKTASLMALSCEAGALAADAGGKNAGKAREFGRNLGLAFQIGDDIEDSGHKKKALKRMRKEATLLISKAKECIAPFGKKADGLRYIADKILEKAKDTTGGSL